MTDTNAVIAMYDNRSAAEGAVKQLQKSGFDMKSYRLWGRIITRTSKSLATTTWETG